MNDLDLLKQDWNKDKPNEFKTYSEEELFRMTKKKSVSIAKWVFVVGALELLFWISIHFLLFYHGEESKKSDENISSFLKVAFYFADILDIISKCIPFLFLGLLIYLNHKIRNTEDPKRLMEKILLMRNAVKWYIRLFLIQLIFVLLFGFALSIWRVLDEITNPNDYIDLLLLVVLICFFSLIIILFFRFIYHLIYGNLIYKLEDNYKELAKMETQD